MKNQHRIPSSISLRYLFWPMCMCASIHMHMFTCMWAHEWGEGAYAHVCSNMPRPDVDTRIFLSLPVLCGLRQDFSLEPKVIQLMQLVVNPPPRIQPLSLSSESQDYQWAINLPSIYVSSGYPNYTLRAYSASSFSTHVSLRPLLHHLKLKEGGALHM